MSGNKPKSRSPWVFIPSLYFAEGIPFIIVNQLSVALFKSLQASNTFIGFTSFLYIPWSIKFLWSPFIEARGTKRNWIIITHLLLGIMLGLSALSLQLPSFYMTLLVIFTITAFVSATNDIATDGFYLYALNKDEQAFFTGIRSTFYRFAMLFSGGLLVTLAGAIGTSTGAVKSGWTISLGIAGLIFILLFFYHRFILPFPETEPDNNQSAGGIPFRQVFSEYFSQKKLGVILSFILLYRFGEGLLLKMVQPFLMDNTASGGMGISLSEVGIIYGTFGLVALVAGGITGGWLIKKSGLKKLIWPLAFAIHLPNILFIYLAALQPQLIWHFDLNWLAQMFSSSEWFINVHPLVQSCIMVEQFGYGLGFSSYTVYLLYISKGRYKTSFYAISTGLMAIGMMVPGFLSGVVQQQYGYMGLFIIGTILTIPGMISIFFLPFEEEE